MTIYQCLTVQWGLRFGDRQKVHPITPSPQAYRSISCKLAAPLSAPLSSELRGLPTTTFGRGDRTRKDITCYESRHPDWGTERLNALQLCSFSLTR